MNDFSEQNHRNNSIISEDHDESGGVSDTGDPTYTMLDNPDSFEEQSFDNSNTEYPETEDVIHEESRPADEPNTSNEGEHPQNDHIPTAKYASMEQFTQEFWKERKQKMLDIPECEMMMKTKNMSVPMARVKKIMRIDDDVRSLMIASDAPIFMAQAAEFFIEEMTGMAWQFVSESRRRILQKSDVASAVQQSDQFDFLIDFLPPKPRNLPKKDVPETNHPREKKPQPFLREEKKPNFHNIPKTGNHPMAQRKRMAPTDPSTITLDNNAHNHHKPSTSDKFQCVVNETPRGNEFQITKMGSTPTKTPYNRPSTSSASASTSSGNSGKPRPPPPQPTERNVVYYGRRK